MEKVWKLVCLCLVVSFFKLCNGLPIHLESTIPADPSVEILSEVIVILLTVCTVLLLVGCLCCHRPNGFKEFRDSPVAVSTVSNVDNGLVNPSAEGAFTIFAPLGHQNFSSSNDRFRLEEEYSYGDINVSSWFNEGVYDFPRTKLKYIRELGKGWFGSVVEGTAQDPDNNTWTPVVVRILDSTASTKEKVFFLHEAEIYKCGNHTNLLKLHGRCLNSAPYLLLQELCTQGDLKGYLLSNRGNNNLLVSEYPLIWCCQIASALKFLHEKGLAHPDLACRNCQLTSNLTVKLGDYGLSSSRYPEDYYEGTPTISVRWCAPESIKHTSTTIQPERITREANVWSLAVCFWEICECGARPYADLSDDEVVTQVLGRAHARLPRPSRIVLYTDYIYGLMQSCWLTPESRPTSTQIYLTLTDLLQVFTVCKSESKDTASLEGSQESFDMRWNSLKPNNNAGNLEYANEKREVKPMSPSMNNLIGSLDDMNRSRTSEEDNAHSVLLPGKTDQKFEFELSSNSKEPLETDSLDDSMVYNMRRSSSSETEEENWKRKIERGAYTEKVRQKSRSVTDLMVLTHIDCSESESETPQPSLDHRVNYKNVRLAPRHNLESASYVHGSEGNLLSVQDDFQAELRKLQEGHRDSLFFVPDKYSQTLRNEQVNNNLDIDRNICLGDSSSNERLVKELSGTSDITPVNQVYNVFNVTIDNLSPIHVVKLNEIINLEESLEFGENKTFISYEVPKLCDIIQNNSMVATFPDNLNTVCINGNHDGNSETPHFSDDDICPTEMERSDLDQTEIGHTFLIEPSLPTKNEINDNLNSSLETSHNEIESNYSVKEIEAEQQIKSCNEEKALVVEVLSEKIEKNNDLDTIGETFKTEESHVDERLCEIKIDDKHDILGVPDKELNCDESVLNDKLVLHFQDAKEAVMLGENLTENNLVSCESENDFRTESNQEEHEAGGEKHTEADIPEMELHEEIGDQLVSGTSENFVNTEKVQIGEHEKRIEGIESTVSNLVIPTESPSNPEDSSGSVEEVNRSDVSSETSNLKAKNTLEDLYVFQMGENLNSFEMNSQISDTDFSLPSERFKDNMGQIDEDIDNAGYKPKDFPERRTQKEESMSKEHLIKNLGMKESDQLVSSPSENFVNTEKVQMGEPEKKLDGIESTVSKLVNQTESPSNSEDSLGSVEEVNRSDVSSETSNLKAKNTLEDLYVFQMGENLNSFEMNSQISDTDFSLPSERFKDSMGQIDEDIDNAGYEPEDFPERRKQNEESMSKEHLMKNLGMEESDQLVSSPSENFVNTEKVQIGELEKKPDGIESTVSKLVNLTESLSNLEDSLGSVEEVNSSDVSSETSNLKAKNTLEDLYVFQMGENLNSFELNSQISDTDFSLPSERFKDSMGQIDEVIDNAGYEPEDFPERRKHNEESMSKEHLMKNLGMKESDQLVSSPSENFVNTEKVQIGELEKKPDGIESTVSKLVKPTESASNSEDSLGSVEEVNRSDVSSEILNLKAKNTLEDLYVFQMGENLNSFEMNSQISDTDFSLTSERFKDSMGQIDEEIDNAGYEPEDFPERRKQKEESMSKKHLMKKLGMKESVGKNRQEAKSFQVPKLIDLIENDDKLMDYIITKYESELHDVPSCESTSVTEKSEEKRDYPAITFDLSNSQEAASPNPLTHLNAFSSLRTKQKSSLELISSTPGKKADLEDPNSGGNLNYSLETWDSFLGNAIDTQTRNINDQTVVFESLNSEPQSLIFIEAEGGDPTVTPPNSDIELSLEGGFLEDVYGNQTINVQEECNELNKTFEVEESELNKTYDVSTLEGSFSMEECASDEQYESGTWDSSGGWFLHPQSSGSVSGQITEQRDARSMDDEILAALRGELLAKLPHAQGSTNDKLKENDEEWEQNDKEEVFLRYNVYNTPLSPIPEESENEEESDYVCTATGSPASGASDDWPEKLLENAAPQENDSQSLKAQGLHHQRTLSQDSYCSNDTLFNLEDMTYVVADQEEKAAADDDDDKNKLEEERIKRDAIDYFKVGAMPPASPLTDLESPLETAPDKTFLEDFLVREREHSDTVSVVVTEPAEENRSDSNSCRDKTAAPLPSPDDHPWKRLSDSLLRKGLLEAEQENADREDSADSTTYENEKVYEEDGTETELYSNVVIEDDLPVYENVDGKIAPYENVKVEKTEENLPSYVNVVGGKEAAVYENVGNVDDVLNEEDYVNIANMENAKISADSEKAGGLEGDENPEDVQLGEDLLIGDEEGQDDQMFGVLTDIRFSGPGESHLMSTSFSESNEMQNEQDWESGSDTRSSSSGEFIWREGEHEESLKALQALPQDLLDDIEPDKVSKEETSSESSCSEDEGECPEFIPSAWDKYATPTKSALRSPEKTLEKEEKKKGVWFKKQRYHCVYEYPKEPESPVLQSFDLWNNPPPATSYPEWYFDIDSNTEFNDFTTTTNFSDGDNLSTDFTTTTFNNEFFVTGSATPFDMMTSTSSQFFPGGDHWSDLSKLNENTTPDSGVEDVTPGSMDRLDLAGMASSNVPTLKLLSEAAYARLKLKVKENKTNEILGGLRHTRNKLKLDLPSSPNTFSSNKSFNLEPNVEPVVIRERPAFTTFGKSRFLVQHVDTPDKDVTGRNVCFEALPYKPIEKKEQESKTKKIKKEEEKGEASLLDSADEDSGIESSTLERKSCEAGKLIVDL